MKIELGKVLNKNGDAIKAWLEPTRSKRLGKKSPIFDDVNIILESTNPLGTSSESSITNSMTAHYSADLSGYKRLISDGAGYDAIRFLMEEAKKYRESPYFAVCENPKYGRLYARQDAAGERFIIETRPDSETLADSTDIFRTIHLDALLIGGYLETTPTWMPQHRDLYAAVEYAHAERDRIFTALADYQPIQRVLDEYIDRGADYESLNLQAVRPALSSFVTDEPEFYRWYNYGGTPRQEPLTKELLEAFYQAEFGRALGLENPAPSYDSWEWVKNERLGALRPPIEALQSIVAAHQPLENHPWLAPAARQADWVSTKERPDAAALFNALEGLVFRGEAIENQTGLPPEWLESARRAQQQVWTADSQSDIDWRHPDLQQTMFDLQQAMSDLKASAEKYQQHLITGDIDELQYYRHEVSRIVQEAPVLTGLVTLEPMPVNTNEHSAQEPKSVMEL